MCYSPALLWYPDHCEQSLFAWIYFCPRSHLRLHLGRYELYRSISKGAYSHSRKRVSFTWVFLPHIPFWTVTTWFPSLLRHLLGSNFVYLYTIYIVFTLFLHSQLHEIKTFILLTLHHLKYIEQCLACNSCLQNMCWAEPMNIGRSHCVIKKGTELGVWHLSISHK